MTVSYTAQVATCQKFGFLKLLFRWKGSVYKLVWMDLCIFLVLYYLLNALYRFALNTDSKKAFENFVHYCRSYGTLIPLSFVLGFYVSIVMQRWWDQYIVIPWPDPIAVFVSVHVHGQDERGRVIRRTVMRYVCLCLTMVLSMISPRVKKRFPTLDHLVDAGLLVESEKKIFESMDLAFPKHPKHWMPIVWASSIIANARKEGRIRDDFAVKTIIDELNKLRGNCGVLMYYDAISIPLVYTQVVTLAVYTYFLCSVVSYQWTEEQSPTGYMNLIDCYFPFFSTLQFFFYMGWLKVAESLINPFGDDDDDFEVNWMIDRNLQVSYLIVDEMHHEHPELVRDQYWDVFPNELPYNDADIKHEEPPEPSTARIVNLHPSSATITSQTRLNGMLKSNLNPLPAQYNLHSDLTTSFTPDHLGTLSGQTSTPNAPTAGVREPVVKSSGNVRIRETTEFIEPVDFRNMDEQSMSPNATVTEQIFPVDENTTLLSSRDSTFSISAAEEGDDDFERLRAQREKERIERLKQRLAQNLMNLAARVSESEINSPHPAPPRGNKSQHNSKSSAEEENQDEKEDTDGEQESKHEKKEKK